MQTKNVNLSDIKSNPHSPRKTFKGPKFNELVDSIRQKGVIEPIIIRPISEDSKKYEVVAGERRLRASCLISKNKNVQSKIPAIIKELTDDEAFDYMVIENLQREDLTAFEEAKSFKQYFEKKGKGSIPELAKRIGKSPGYIRRKIAVLSLPNYIVKAWEKEELQFSHLEQLRRLKNKEELKEAFDYATGRRFGRGSPVSRRELKENIDNMAPPLNSALFDWIKECSTCGQNSNVQQKLWEIDGMKGAHCLDKKCFKQKQNNFLLANWKQSKYRRRFGTNGFRFKEDFSWSEYNSFEYGPKPSKKCKECEHFLTVITLEGAVNTGQACFGEESCFRAVRSAKAKEEHKKERAERGEPEGPRVPWHGEHFREEFLSKRIPQRYQEFEHSHIKMAHMALFAFVKSDQELLYLLKRETKLKDTYEDSQVFKIIAKMELDEVQELMKKCALKVIMRHWPVTCEGRLAIATHLGINLMKEFAVTKEYLEKKTIREMLEFGKKSKLFFDPVVIRYLRDVIKGKGFEKCKKTELIDLFLKSGVNLVGKVPDEIIPKKN